MTFFSLLQVNCKILSFQFHLFPSPSGSSFVNYPFIFPLHFKSVSLLDCLFLRLKFAQVFPILKQCPVTLLQALGRSAFLFCQIYVTWPLHFTPNLASSILTYFTSISPSYFLVFEKLKTQKSEGSLTFIGHWAAALPVGVMSDMPGSAPSGHISGIGKPSPKGDPGLGGMALTSP